MVKSAQNHHPKSNPNCKSKITIHSETQIEKEEEEWEEEQDERRKKRKENEKKKEWVVWVKSWWGHMGRCEIIKKVRKILSIFYIILKAEV